MFEKAYKILLFQDMIEQGERFAHVDTPGGYIEVDTQQDFEYARQNWTHASIWEDDHGQRRVVSHIGHRLAAAAAVRQGPHRRRLPDRGRRIRRLMGDAIRAAVALQETAGLDVVTDGEWWRKSYIGVIAELAHGFELSRNPADGRPWTVVVDKLSPKQPGFIAQEIAFLKQLTKRQTQGDRAGAGPAGRADVGSGEIGEGLSEARGFRPRLRADLAPRSRAAARRRRVDRAGRRSAPVLVRRSAGPQPIRRCRAGVRLRRRHGQPGRRRHRRA